MRLTSPPEANTAQIIARQGRCGQAKHETNKGLVSFAAGLFGRIVTARPRRVVKVVQLNHNARHSGKIPVYDLTVENNHCYYANGILVSNSDAMRYASYIIQLHKESLYRPGQFEYPKDYRKPMVAKNLMYSRR
jgi:hypothetical protein